MLIHVGKNEKFTENDGPAVWVAQDHRFYRFDFIDAENLTERVRFRITEIARKTIDEIEEMRTMLFGLVNPTDDEISRAVEILEEERSSELAHILVCETSIGARMLVDQREREEEMGK